MVCTFTQVLLTFCVTLASLSCLCAVSISSEGTGWGSGSILGRPSPFRKQPKQHSVPACASCTARGCGCNTEKNEPRCICVGDAGRGKQEFLGAGLAERIDADVGKRKRRMSERHAENAKLYALALQIVKKKETEGLIEAKAEATQLEKDTTGETPASDADLKKADIELSKVSSELKAAIDNITQADSEVHDARKPASVRGPSASSVTSDSGPASGSGTGAADAFAQSGAGAARRRAGLVKANPCDPAALRTALRLGSNVDDVNHPALGIGRGESLIADCFGRFPNGTVAATHVADISKPPAVDFHALKTP